MHNFVPAVCLFHNPNPDGPKHYQTDYPSAQPLCQGYGGNLATLDDLQKVFETGWDMCRYGWIDGAICV